MLADFSVLFGLSLALAEAVKRNYKIPGKIYSSPVVVADVYLV